MIKQIFLLPIFKPNFNYLEYETLNILIDENLIREQIQNALVDYISKKGYEPNLMYCSPKFYSMLIAFINSETFQRLNLTDKIYFRGIEVLPNPYLSSDFELFNTKYDILELYL